MVQIRNVPDDLHRRLKARAALEGMSLSEYALLELGKALDRPSRRELLDRVRARSSVDGGASSVELVRAERDRP
jgi:plasmid stability protein